PQALALSRRVQAVFLELLRPLQLAVTVSMDLGVAIFPQDAEHADQLIRIADERLYRLKNANHAKAGNESPRAAEFVPAAESSQTPATEVAPPMPPPISIESRRAPEKPETMVPPAASASAIVTSGELPPSPAPIFRIQRKA